MIAQYPLKIMILIRMEPIFNNTFVSSGHLSKYAIIVNNHPARKGRDAVTNGKGNGRLRHPARQD